jgi:hypothetical protein
MEVIPYETENYDNYINSIVMVPESDNGMNGFYKIIKSSSNNFFLLKKMKCETKLVKTNETKNSNIEKKIYEAIISNDFENDKRYKKIKKTSINKKYPLIICSVVRYEI